VANNAGREGRAIRTRFEELLQTIFQVGAAAPAEERGATVQCGVQCCPYPAPIVSMLI
jgi:hypothetical protein